MCRLVIHVTGSVETNAESAYCQSENCYSACGDLTPYDAMKYRGGDQIFRFFFVNLTRLSSYVGTDAKRVFVYAQTVLIDTDVTFSFSVLIHTRQLIIDQRSARRIRISSLTPVFDLDFKNRETFGVRLDPLFMKQSFMCARILLDTRERANANTAWSILHDLTHSNTLAVSNEQLAWLNAVNQFKGFLTGIDRHNIRFVPFYSKEYFTRLLQLYHTRITDYNNQFERMLDATTSQSQYLQSIVFMIGVFESTSLSEATSALNLQLDVLDSSSISLYKLKSKYDDAFKTTTSIGEKMVNSRLSIGLIFKVITSFIKFLFNLGKKLSMQAEIENKRREAEALQREIQIALEIQLSGLTTSLCEADASIAQLTRFLNVSDIIIASLKENDPSFNYEKYEDDIEVVVSFKVRQFVVNCLFTAFIPENLFSCHLGSAKHTAMFRTPSLSCRNMLFLVYIKLIP